MKKTLVIGTSAKSERVPHANTGNMMHAETARRLLTDYDNFPFREWTEEEVEKANSEYGHILFVAANGIRPGAADDLPIVKSHEILERNFSRTNLPIVTLGLGAQQHFNAEATELPNATKRMLSVLSERSREIAVRGDNTQSILEKAGIKNTTVMGCQSCFWSMKPQLDADHFNQYDENASLAFNYTAPGAEYQIIDLAIKNDAYVYGQEEYNELLASEGDREALRDSKKFKNYLRKTSLDEAQFLNWIDTRFSQIYDLQKWFERMAMHRFCFGTRFHGNMVALQAGVKTLWVVHDRRTEELCNHLALPYIRAGKIKEDTRLSQLEEMADYTEFFKKYPGNYRKLYDYLTAAGLPHRLPRP